jgi:hypothetical protein
MRLDLSPILHARAGVSRFRSRWIFRRWTFTGNTLPLGRAGFRRGAQRSGRADARAWAEAELFLRCDRCTKPFVRRKTVKITQLLAETLENEEEDTFFSGTGRWIWATWSPPH